MDSNIYVLREINQSTNNGRREVVYHLRNSRLQKHENDEI